MTWHLFSAILVGVAAYFWIRPRSAPLNEDRIRENLDEALKEEA